MEQKTFSTSRWNENIGPTIDSMLNVWARRTGPFAVSQFLRYINFLRSMYVNDKGFTRNKKMLFVAEIPKRLALMMDAVFGIEWRNKPEVSKEFFKRIYKFRVNQTTIPMARPEWAFTDERDRK